jgi:hypothetical protein
MGSAVIAAMACSQSSETASTPDAGSSDASAPDTAAPTPPRSRDVISHTGLYADVGKKTVAANAIAFEPAFALWSDGAEKKRWITVPPGTSIDASDPDHFVLPVGAQLFKEFSLGGKRLETRLIERLAATGKDSDYFFGAFVWRDDESDADFVPAGAENVRGTDHDVPSAEACSTCHIGEPGHALGFSARQLSHDRAGLNLAAMRERGIVPPSVTERPIPGDPAVGYLHANCGHCHNINGVAWPDTDMTLRLGYGESDLASSAMVKSTVGIRLQSYRHAGYELRIDPGSPDTSAVLFRMGERGDAGAMPPIATEKADTAAMDRVRAWISGLPK